MTETKTTKCGCTYNSHRMGKDCRFPMVVAENDKLRNLLRDVLAAGVLTSHPDTKANIQRALLVHSAVNFGMNRIRA